MPASNSQTEAGPPDGGFRAWRTVFGCFLMQFCGFGYVSSFGVYQDDFGRLLHTNLYDEPSTIYNIMDRCIGLVSHS
ncbi:hypothetical protein EV424DRAFT_1402793 [Suillus variegatus]|nr:hypothetical protein EV424DRAFT_1402793 [Suillus variegatus]